MALSKGTAVDPQTAGPDLARFFLNSYLGCQVRVRPDVTTQRFFDAVQDYGNNVTTDEHVRTTLAVALVAEMHGPAPTVSSPEFAARTVPVQERDAFLEHLERRDVPRQPFDKDTTLVRGVAKVQFDYAAGSVLLTPPEQIEGDNPTVSFTVDEDGRPRTEITDRIVKAQGKGASRVTDPAPPRGGHDPGAANPDRPAGTDS